MIERFLGNKVLDLTDGFDGPASILIKNENIRIVGGYLIINLGTNLINKAVYCRLVRGDN